jgi:hypothetical protein
MTSGKAFVFALTLTFMFPLLAHSQRFGRQKDIKSVSEARGLALNNTLLPVATGIGAVYLFKNNTVQTVGAALAVYGLIMGPSAGNFYAEDYMRGTLGAMMRIGSGYLLLDATRELMGDRVADRLAWDDKRVSISDTQVLVGAGVFAGSMLYNLLSAGASVREYNQQSGYSFYVVPGRVNQNLVPLLTARFDF